MVLSTNPAAGIASLQLCFYGAGSLAEALARGILNKELTAPSQVSMINRSNRERLAELSERYGVHTILNGADLTNEQFLQRADVIFLAMKPKDAAAAIESIRPLVSDNQLIISLIAGLSISSIERLLDRKLPIVRTMPNTSSTIGLGATGISYSDAVSPEQRAIAEAIFQSVGINAIVDESLQDSITGVSGSGPAYVYYFMEAMLTAAEKLGLDSASAKDLVVQTVLGAAEMVRLTGETPQDLRRKVTSPNGTTQAAIEKLTEGGFSDIVVQAMLRSSERAAEIGADFERSTSK
ncbi:pyrroline-5-carboxylate reductase [Paenibacillus sp. NPDC058071]|uniref:pyrroline-5-carboxylate reductase n=1 Tax=Paenibacillus sp. NPDC058071 TaxID=3346326 RepID=UPI0036DEF3B1